jgi:hypothetical protein
METLTAPARAAQVAGQQARERAVSRMAEAERQARSRESWLGQVGELRAEIRQASYALASPR